MRFRSSYSFALLKMLINPYTISSILKKKELSDFSVYRSLFQPNIIPKNVLILYLFILATIEPLKRDFEKTTIIHCHYM